MSNKLVQLIITVILILGLPGCSKNTDSQLSDLQKENNSLKSELTALQSNDNINETTENQAQSNEAEAIEIKIGDTISTENKEIKINNVEFSYDVLPDKTDIMYSHYQADTDHVYIHIDTDVKNLQKQNLPCTQIMDVVADYNNGFTYNAFPIPENSITGFDYANIVDIKPLETLGVRFLIDCPQEVEETDNPIFLAFKVDEKNYKYTIR